MVKLRVPRIPRLKPYRTEFTIQRDLAKQFESIFERYEQWSKPDADSIRSAEEGHVRRGVRQKYLGDTEIGGPRLRSSRSRKLQVTRKSLQKEI